MLYQRKITNENNNFESRKVLEKLPKGGVSDLIWSCRSNNNVEKSKRALWFSGYASDIRLKDCKTMTHRGEDVIWTKQN